MDPADRQRSMRCVIISSVTAVIAMMCMGGSVLNLVAIKLGAGEIMLGLLAFAQLGPSLARVFTMSAIERVGKRKIILRWFFVSVVFALPLLALPYLADNAIWSSRACLILLLAGVFLRGLASELGNTGWFPLLQDIVPKESTGRFFALLRGAWQTAGLLTLLGIAWLLGRDPSWQSFQIVFVVAVLAWILRAAALIPVTERPPLPSDRSQLGIFQRFREVIADPSYRVLVLYMIIYSAAFAAPVPFRIKLVKDLGYSDGFILAASAMTGLGAILTLRFWGRLADRYGNRAIFSISHIGMIVVTLLWWLVDSGSFSSVLIFLLYFLASVFHSGNGIAQTRYILHAVPPDKQNRINVINTISHSSCAVAPLLGGLLLRMTDGFSFQSGALTLNNYHLFFLICALTFIIPHMLRRKLGLVKDTPTVQVIAFVTSTLRNTFGPFLGLGKNDPNEE